MTRAAEKPKTEPFVISRVFDAPRELVFKAFTDPEHMKHWWGPKGFKVIAAEHGSTSRRDLSLWAPGARRLDDVGTLRLSRDRGTRTHRFDQFVLRRKRRRHAPSYESWMAVGDVVDILV